MLLTPSMQFRRKPRIESPPKPLWKRILRSLLRITTLLVVVLGGLYLWNPQRLHYYPKPTPVPNPRVDPDSAKLFAKGTRVTMVVGHPDDAEFFISGTLLKLHKAGALITLILLTDGDKSYYPPFFTNPEENRKVRRQEQTDASAAYDAKLVFLAGPDGRYNPDAQPLRDQLRDAMVASKPDYILTFESEYLPMVQHRDHENSGRAALELARDTSAKWVLLFSSTAANYYVDTTGFWEERARLLAVHKSQFYGEKLERVENMVFERTLNTAEDMQAENSSVETAESFRVVKL